MRLEVGSTVLILVLVEHTLGGLRIEATRIRNFVLILVLVEHTLGADEKIWVTGWSVGLNPCFSGTYSRRNAPLLMSPEE